MTLKNNKVSLRLCQSLCITSKPSVNSKWSYSAEMCNSDQNWWFFCPMWPWNLMDDIKNNRASFLSYSKLCASFRSHQSIQIGVTIWKHPIWVKIGDFFVQSDLEIWQMTLKNNRAPLLFHFKLCALFYNHLWIPAEVTIWKRPIWVKISDFLFCVNLEAWHDLEKQQGISAMLLQALCIIL